VTNFPSQEVWERMVGHRQHLHENPEVGIELPDTHAYVRKVLEELGLTVEHHPSAGVSVAIPGTGSELPPLVFRADMDALPVEQDVSMVPRSLRPGAMHACGHDLHTATLLGFAEDVLLRPTARDIVLAFQPGEESHRGAVKLLEHRNLQLIEAETFAIHVNAVLPTGSISYSETTFMAYGDWFRLDFSGPGGHASAPERAGNPIRAGAQWVEALQGLVDSIGTPESRVVATVTEFLSGNTVNVIPVHGSLRGTIRCVTEAQRSELHEAMHALALSLGAQHELEVSLEITEGYPAVISDPGFLESFLDTVGSAGLGHQLNKMDHASMVIEDFSYFLHKWPGIMVYVGAAVGDSPSFNHSASAEFDESAMKTAFALLRALAPVAA